MMEKEQLKIFYCGMFDSIRKMSKEMCRLDGIDRDLVWDTARKLCEKIDEEERKNGLL